MLMESIPLSLGTTMPHFELASPAGDRHTLAQLTGPKGLFISFTCNHCPYAIAIWPRVIELSKTLQTWGIETVAINPNINPNYPADRPEAMSDKIEEWGIPFPYLVDHDQSVARAYQAQCTPDLYLLNAEHELVYHGQLDDNWREPNRVTRQDLRLAAEQMAHGQTVNSTQQPSMGCSIKWVD